MQARLSLLQVVVLATYAAGMAGGQMLFKLAADRVPGAAGAGFPERILGLALNGYFIAAVLLYGLLSVLWVWVLTFTPLSRAYPFVALAFAVTPLLAAALFHEPLGMRLLAGIGLVVGGLFLVIG